MITGVHAMFYTPQAEELRAFFRDKLRVPYYDAGENWLIFTPPAGEIGCHPDQEERQEISLWCDHIHATVKELESRGVQFEHEVRDWGYGLGTYLIAPGGLRIQLYQPTHPKPA